MDISVDSVCQFIVDHGGKVKNTVLVSHFKKILNDPATKESARQKFKECVNAVAVVKNENGEKYVQLKKKFRGSTNSTSDSPSSNLAQSPQDGSFEQPKINESIQSQDASFTATDTLPYIETSNGKSTSHSERKREEVKQSSPIKKTKKQTSPKHISQEKSPQHKQSPSKAHGQAPEAEDSNNQKNRISQPMIEPEKPQFTEEETHFKYNANRKSSKDDKMDIPGTERVSAAKASFQQPATDSADFAVPSAAPLRKKKKENIAPSPNPEQRWTSVDRVKSSLLMNMTADNRMGRMRPSSTVQGSYAGSVERVRQNFQTKQKTSEDAASIAPSEKSLDSKGEEIDDEYDRNIPSIALDINEKSWIIRSAQGNLVEMRILLDLDSTLVEKRDFIMNALHWAAKKGSIEMLEMLVDQKIDINCKTGYTALHLAAMNGHKEIISRLLDFGADVNVRDYSGHKPVHYLKSMADNPFGIEVPQETVKDPVVVLRSKNQTLSVKSSKIGKTKKSKKGRDERPTISVVSVDDSDSGFVNLSNPSLSGLALSSANSMNIRMSAPSTPNISNRRKSGTKGSNETNDSI